MLLVIMADKKLFSCL